MASQVGRIIQDQNLNVQYKGASTRGKPNTFKTQKKGEGLGWRKPLGDLSNSVKPVKPAHNQSIKKLNPKDSSTGKEISASKITSDGSKKKSTRKALSDISNSSMPLSHDASKKNLKGKHNALSNEHLCSIAEEGFLHNHDECIKAQTKSMDMDEFLEIIGLDKGFFNQSSAPSSVVSPAVGNLEPASPLRLLDLEELEFEHGLPPWKYENSSKLESPSPLATPKSLKWGDDDDYLVNFHSFTLIDSPTKH